MRNLKISDIGKEKIRETIGQIARKINNFADCDVIQEALEQVENAKTDEDTLEAIAYLATAIRYRGYSDTEIQTYKNLYSYTSTIL